MRTFILMILVLGSVVTSVHAEEKLALWPYIDQAATQDQKDRKIEGLSYIVGGATAILLPFLTTNEGSGLRTIGTATLVPIGAISVLYGGYALVTDSPWMSLKKRVEKLSGPEEDSNQWRLRREAHSREALLERADTVRFWRNVWGGVSAGAGIYVVSSSQSAPSLISGGLLLGIAAYHFLHKKTDERLIDQLDKTVAGITPDGRAFIAYRISLD